MTCCRLKTRVLKQVIIADHSAQQTARRSFAARIYGYGLVGLLALASAAGMAAIMLAPNTETGEKLAGENRTRNTMPPLPGTAAEWVSFPLRFEAFVNDNFGLRDTLIRTSSVLSTAMLGRLPTDQVIAGTGGWLFFTGNRSLELFQRTFSLDQATLDQWNAQLVERKRALDARGIPYVFTIAPDKHTVYGEFMPRHLRRSNAPSQYDQFMMAARSHGIPAVDLRQDLLRAKKNDILYYRDDSHWNERGAVVVYNTLMTSLDLHPIAVDNDAFDLHDKKQGDLSLMALISRTEKVPIVRRELLPCQDGVPDRFTAGMVTRTRCDGKKGKLLFLHDSFGPSMLHLFAASFGEVIAIGRYTSTEAFLATVEAERPDFVIEERVERYLQFPPVSAGNALP